MPRIVILSALLIAVTLVCCALFPAPGVAAEKVLLYEDFDALDAAVNNDLPAGWQLRNGKVSVSTLSALESTTVLTMYG